MTEHELVEGLEAAGWAEVVELHDPDADLWFCPYCGGLWPEDGPGNICQHIGGAHPDTALGQWFGALA